MKFQVCKSAIVRLRGHQKRFAATVLLSAQADNRFTKGPDFNPGCSF
jgi:hypothetical protein